MILAAVEAVALVAVVWLLLRHHQRLERAWTEERRELLTRIQRPELVPLQQVEPFVAPDQEPDEVGLVGTIMYANDDEGG